MADCSNQYDAELLHRMAAYDDEEAFASLYHQYWQKLYLVAHQRLKSSVAAEEIVQEVFVNLWMKRKDLTINLVSAYLAAMTRYAVYRSLASKKRRQEKELFLARNQSIAVDAAKQMDDKILLQIITDLSNTLPEKCRLVFVYNKLLDQPLPQVASNLNISVKTAEAHLTKALKFIRTGIAEKDALKASLLLLMFLD